MTRGHDLVGVTALGLLSIRESHPYELQRFIVNTYKGYLTGLPRSLYLAVQRLNAAGLIEASEKARDGRRPERTTYRITAQGRADLTDRLRQMLAEPDPDRRVLTAALSLIGCVPVAVAAEALRARRATVGDSIAALAAGLAQVKANELPDLVALKLEHERSLQQAEADWLDSVLSQLADGVLDWPHPLDGDPFAAVQGEEHLEGEGDGDV